MPILSDIEETVPSRILALDFGTRRIGVAVTDPLGITAQPLQVIQCAGAQTDVEAVVQLVQDYNAPVLVIGLPRRTDGEEGTLAKKVRKFANKVADACDVEIELWDEWFTTVQAGRILADGGLNTRKAREVIDSVAASLILESWMSAQDFSTAEEDE